LSSFLSYARQWDEPRAVHLSSCEKSIHQKGLQGDRGSQISRRQAALSDVKVTIQNRVRLIIAIQHQARPVNRDGRQLNQTERIGCARQGISANRF